MSSASFSSVNGKPLRVLKFGGTSVGTATAMQRAAQIIARSTEACRPVIVVSAAGGVTDVLVQAADEAPHSTPAVEQWIERVADRHHTLAAELLDDEALQTRYASLLQARLSTLHRVLVEQRVQEASAARDAVLATGERLMVPLLAAVLVEAGCRAEAVDAASLLRTDASHGAAEVDWPRTRERVCEWDDERGAECVPVVTGFIGSTDGGTTTTLGRGGSDYSAALLARALEAERLERWTDVDALYTCDPAENKEAQRLSHIPMEKARAWTKEGRLGLHPRTLDPLSAAGIPLHIRCTYRPEAAGTHIVPSVSTPHR